MIEGYVQGNKQCNAMGSVKKYGNKNKCWSGFAAQHESQSYFIKDNYHKHIWRIPIIYFEAIT